MAGFVRIRQIESRPNLCFGRTLRLSSDRHDLIPPPLPTIMKKTLHILTILLLPLTVFGQSDYWARLSISGGVSELGISPSEEIWVATKAGNVYYTKQIGELWHIGPFGSLDPYNISTGKTFERVNFSLKTS